MKHDTEIGAEKSLERRWEDKLDPDSTSDDCKGGAAGTRGFYGNKLGHPVTFELLVVLPRRRVFVVNISRNDAFKVV